MDIRPIILEGRWVRLESMKMEHAVPLFENGQDERIWPYMPTTPRHLDDMRHIIQNALKEQEKGKEIPFVIRDNGTGELVGSTRFIDIQQVNRNLEIGWTWMSPSVWRTAINTEAKYLLLTHAFEVLRCIRVQIKTDGRNTRSQAAIERLGAVKEGLLRKNRIVQNGFIRDTVYYSILEDEWALIKHRLEGFLQST